MKKLVAVAFAALIVNFGAFGQGVKPNLRGGSKALLFSFAGFSFLNAGSFDGGFGAKYFFSRNLALRGTLRGTRATEDLAITPLPGETGTDGEVTATTVGAFAGLEYHFGSGRVSPYVGAGGGFATTSTESKDPVINPTPQTTTKHNLGGEVIDGQSYQAGTTFEAFALLGTEFFIFKELSLSAEYQMVFSRLSAKDQEVTVANVTTMTRGGSGSMLGITTSGVLTLAVYY